MRNLTVLVADDEIQTRKFLAAVVAREKLPVATLLEADNGLDAVRLAQEHRPDLAFLDIRMPGQDGLAAAEALISGSLCPRVIIVSAYGEFDYAQKALRAGAVDYLLKPVKPDDFAAIIKNAARQSELDTGRSAPGASSSRPAVVQAVLDYIEANIDTPLRIASIAKAVHVSPWHLSRTFKRLAGTAIAQYVFAARIRKAKELLVSTELPVTEVAGRAGFGNSGYFATCFKQATGQSPLQYRKNKGSSHADNL